MAKNPVGTPFPTPRGASCPTKRSAAARCSAPEPSSVPARCWPPPPRRSLLQKRRARESDALQQRHRRRPPASEPRRVDALHGSRSGRIRWVREGIRDGRRYGLQRRRVRRIHPGHRPYLLQAAPTTAGGQRANARRMPRQPRRRCDRRRREARPAVHGHRLRGALGHEHRGLGAARGRLQRFRREGQRNTV